MLPIPGTHEAGFVEERIVQRKVPPSIARQLSNTRGLKVFTMGECSIILGREPAGANEEMLWHLTISCEERHPSWDEIKVARYRLLPISLAFGILLPPPVHYVNEPQQDHVFHLWEVTDPRMSWTTG